MGIKNNTQNEKKIVDAPKNSRSEALEAKNTCNSLFEYAQFLYNNEENPEERLEISAVYEKIKEIFINVRYDHSHLMLALQESEQVLKYPTASSGVFRSPEELVSPAPNLSAISLAQGLGAGSPRINENYVYSHAARTAIITLIIGKYLKIPVHKLIDLGVAALLHDIGMISVPQELYLSSRSLTKSEKTLLDKHPVYGYKLLDAHNYSPAVKLAVLEHHEREDGSGYPQKLTKEHISLYGRIIAVACSYEAISAKRIYRDSVDLHAGMVNILINRNKYYDKAIMALSEVMQHTFANGPYIARPLRYDEIP